MTALWPDPDPGWRVRIGVSLVEHAPMSTERRAQIDREAERERKADELAAEQRREAAFEHRWELERRGVVPHSVSDVLQAASVAQDRQDRRDAAAEERAAVELGKPPPRFDRWQSKKNVEAYEEERQTTAATKADLRDVQSQVTGLKASVHALKETAVETIADGLRRKRR